MLGRGEFFEFFFYFVLLLCSKCGNSMDFWLSSGYNFYHVSLKSNYFELKLLEQENEF